MCPSKNYISSTEKKGLDLNSFNKFHVNSAFNIISYIFERKKSYITRKISKK